MTWNKLCQRSILVQFELQDKTVDKTYVYPVIINRCYQPELDADQSASFYLEKLNQMQLENFSTNRGNIEHENLIYYKTVAVQQLKDTFLSNLFLLATTVSKTPCRYLLGKLSYIAKKMFMFNGN
jgi:hypothetical protein